MIIDTCTDLNAKSPVQLFVFDEVVEIPKQQHDLLAWPNNTNTKTVFLPEIPWAKFPDDNFPLQIIKDSLCDRLPADENWALFVI